MSCRLNQWPRGVVDPFTAAALGQLAVLQKHIRQENINNRNNDGWTVLMYACYYNRVELVMFLVKMGADLTMKCKKGRTSLMLAAMVGKEDILRLVYKREILDSTDRQGMTAVCLAIEYGNHNAAEFLLSKGANPNVFIGRGSCLMIAAERGHFQLVRLLLRHGANPKTTDSQGRTAKDLADQNGYYDIFNLICTYEEATIESILEFLGLQEYLPNFKKFQISFNQFLHLTEEEMKDLGITVFGRRRKLTLFLDQIKGCYEGLF